MSRLRRVRGAVLRLVLDRRLSVLAGVCLILPAVWIGLHDYAWESWVSDGLTLLAVATGIALVHIGMTGRTADWIDPD